MCIYTDAQMTGKKLTLTDMSAALQNRIQRSL